MSSMYGYSYSFGITCTHYYSYEYYYFGMAHNYYYLMHQVGHNDADSHSKIYCKVWTGKCRCMYKKKNPEKNSMFTWF